MHRRLVAVVAGMALAVSSALLSTSATAATPLAARTVTLRATPSSPTSGTNTTLAGKLSGSPTQSSVVLQQLKSGSWVTLKTRTTSSTGAYSYVFGVSTLGPRTYRAYAPATKTLAAAYSAPASITVVAKPKTAFTKTATPTVTGTLQVGRTLAASPGAWSPTPATYAFQWRRNGDAITGARSSTYVLTPDDRGAYVTVEVSASRSGSVTIRESKTSSTVAAGSFTPAVPTITGDNTLGHVLTANTGSWAPQPTTSTFQWSRNGAPIAGATGQTYTSVAADVGAAVRVAVTGARAGYTTSSSTSAPTTVQPVPPPPPPPPPAPIPIPDPEPEPTPEPDPVPTPEPAPVPTPEPAPPPAASTFGDLMRPAAAAPRPSSGITATLRTQAPSWYSAQSEIRWDKPGAFTHSLEPHAFGTLASAYDGVDVRQPSAGAEYVATNSVQKVADVEFTVTGKEFAIRYVTYKRSEVMVWIDDVPLAASAFVVDHPDGSGEFDWIVVNLPARSTVKVRFAGALVFSGVDYRAADPVTVTATPPRFTLGVVSDSYFEPNQQRDLTRSAAVQLHTITGFRVWNLAQSGTGYASDVTGRALTGDHGYPGYKSTPYGGERNIQAIKNAPIDALLVNGTVNDWMFTSAEQRAAVDAFLDRVAAVRPGLPIVLVGVEPLTYQGVPDQTRTQYREMNQNLKDMAALHSNVVGMIDPFTADWLTGSGNAGSPAGDGNQDTYIDVDTVHPNDAGQVYYQGRIADELKPMLAKLPAR